MSHKNKNQTVIDKIKPAIQNAIAYETTKQQVIKQLNKRKQYKERHEKIITTVQAVLFFFSLILTTLIIATIATFTIDNNDWQLSILVILTVGLAVAIFIETVISIINTLYKKKEHRKQ